jgi:hypothetical protein
MTHVLQEIDRVEILTLQDNYIDIMTSDNSEVIQRAIPSRGSEVSNSILAEHVGYQAYVCVLKKKPRHPKKAATPTSHQISYKAQRSFALLTVQRPV